MIILFAKRKKKGKRLEPLGSLTNRKQRSLNIPDRVLLCVYLFQVEIRRKVNVQVSQERKEAVVVVFRSSPARQRSPSPTSHTHLPSRHMCSRIKNPSPSYASSSQRKNRDKNRFNIEGDERWIYMCIESFAEEKYVN